jgi:hypothetical protein
LKSFKITTKDKNENLFYNYFNIINSISIPFIHQAQNVTINYNNFIYVLVGQGGGGGDGGSESSTYGSTGGGGGGAGEILYGLRFCNTKTLTYYISYLDNRTKDGGSSYIYIDKDENNSIIAKGGKTGISGKTGIPINGGNGGNSALNISGGDGGTDILAEFDLGNPGSRGTDNNILIVDNMPGGEGGLGGPANPKGGDAGKGGNGCGGGGGGGGRSKWGGGGGGGGAGGYIRDISGSFYPFRGDQGNGYGGFGGNNGNGYGGGGGGGGGYGDYGGSPGNGRRGNPGYCFIASYSIS